ncbi:ribosome binding protein [Babesia ovata]|uniref:Ribosome binding protein n=1 Tax=Babesia ovata TaxID=189622 RepID=A0A2H6KD59_9APIC|nr:ribosome binding protein [Babesia ovata]GBE60899.1 ribosome binding protein [Babesia ovata]
MAPHGIQLGTLKDCLQFMQWLHNGTGESMQGLVAQNLESRINKYFLQNAKHFSIENVKKGLSAFLSAVSAFYTRLCYNPDPGSYGKKNPSDIVDALLDCLPKFLAAMYFLEYCINNTFGSLGGGGWQYDWPGYEKEWRWTGHYGGHLQKYLRATVGDADHYGGLIPGGFGKDEVKYSKNWWDPGYPQGYKMALDLQDILRKGDYNFFRSVFVSSAIADTGTAMQNTANALSLVRTFCDIVDVEKKRDNGISLIEALNEGLNKQMRSKNNSICWQDLQSHCAQLRGKLSILFNTDKRFDFTGQSTNTGNLNKEELARKTADWFRENLTKVRGKLTEIKTDASPSNDLGDYFTKNLFPYGFTFDGKHRFGMTKRDVQDLMRDWSSVINALRISGDGDLDRLNDILHGKYRDSCKTSEPPPKKPEVPPALPPVEPKEVVPEKKVPVPKKAEGAQNQGKKSEASPNQNNVQSKDKTPAPPVADSAPGPPTGKGGGSGPSGPKGDKSNPVQQGSPDAVTPVSSSAHGSPVQPQQVATPSSSVPLPQPATSSSGPPALPGQPGSPGQGTPADGSGQQPGANQGNVLAQPPSVVGPSSVSTVDQGTGSTGGGRGGLSGDHGGGQNGSQQTSQGTDHGSSSGATASAGPVPGGGGGGGLGSSGTTKDMPFPAAPRPKPTKICDVNYLLNLDAGKNPFCVVKPQKSKPDPIRFSRSDEQLWEVIQEKKFQADIKTGPKFHSTSNLPGNLNKLDHSASEHSPLPTAIRPGHRRPYFVPQERDARQVERDASIETFADGREVEEKDAYPMIMNDAYSGAISLEGNAKFDNANDYRQLLDEQKRQEAHDQLEQHYAEQHKRTKQDDERRWKDAYVDFVSSVSGDPIDYTYQAGALEGNVMPEFSGLIPQPDTLHDQSLAEYDNRMAQRNQKLKELTAANEHENRIITAMQDDHKRIVSDALAAAAESKVKEEEYYEAFSNPLMGTPVSDQSLMSLKSGNYGVQPPIGDFTGMPILDPELASSSMPKVELEPALPTPPIDIEVRNFNSQDNVLKSEITRTHPPPIIHPIDPASPYDTYPGLPPVSPPRDPNSDTEADYNHPSNWGKFKNHGLYMFPNPDMCNNPWNYVYNSSTPPPPSPLPASAHLPPPKTVREMLHWLVGLTELGYIGIIIEYVKSILKEFNKDVSQTSAALDITEKPYTLEASHVAGTLTEACHYAANVLYRIKHKDNSKVVPMPDFSSEYSKFRYSTDPACLLCHLRDYVYACYHQLTFLKVQCSREQSHGGWKDCQYGNNVPKSPLQAFLTDAHDSKFETDLFDPSDICIKSRVNMGFKEEDLPKTQQTGKDISTILSPQCGGDDPLMTLSSYLNCLTRRTPRTTGELVSFFHNFGNSLHNVSSQLSPLGSALSKPHPHCPYWDILAADDLQAIKGIRGSSPPNSIHDKDHPETLSTLIGCGIDNVKCPPHISSTTYRAYALYSSSFAHAYLSWTVYLPDRLWESLLKLHCDLENLQCHDSKAKPLHQCDKAMPLLYSHGFTPPEGITQPLLTCAQVISRLKEVVAGKPIARLMTAMDEFLYKVREPFIYTQLTLWSVAMVFVAHTMLYRMDVLRIRSHLLTTRASHLIDVKALLTKGRKLLSLYRDVDYFDDHPVGWIGL